MYKSSEIGAGFLLSSTPSSRRTSIRYAFPFLPCLLLEFFSPSGCLDCYILDGNRRRFWGLIMATRAIVQWKPTPFVSETFSISVDLEISWLGFLVAREALVFEFDSASLSCLEIERRPWWRPVTFTPGSYMADQSRTAHHVAVQAKISHRYNLETLR